MVNGYAAREADCLARRRIEGDYNNMYLNTGTGQSWEDEQGRKHQDLTYVLIQDKTSGGGIEADLHHVVTL